MVGGTCACPFGCLRDADVVNVSVDAMALRALLVALDGPGHHIRELQAIRSLGNSPIDKVLDQFNQAVGKGLMVEERVVWESARQADHGTLRVLHGDDLSLEIVERGVSRKIPLSPEMAAAFATALENRALRSREPVTGLPDQLRVRSSSLGEPYREVVEIELGAAGADSSVTLLKADALSLAKVVRPAVKPPAPVPGQMPMAGM